MKYTAALVCFLFMVFNVSEASVSYKQSLRDLLLEKVDHQLAFYQALNGECQEEVATPYNSCIKNHETINSTRRALCSKVWDVGFRENLEKVINKAHTLRCIRNSRIVVHRFCASPNVRPILTPKFFQFAKDCPNTTGGKLLEGLNPGQQALYGHELLRNATCADSEKKVVSANSKYQELLLQYPMFEGTDELSDSLDDSDVFNAQFVKASTFELSGRTDEHMEKFPRLYKKICDASEATLASFRPLAKELFGYVYGSYDTRINAKDELINNAVGSVKLASDRCLLATMPFITTGYGGLASLLCGALSTSASSILYLNNKNSSSMVFNGRGVFKDDVLTSSMLSLPDQMNGYVTDLAMEGATFGLASVAKAAKTVPSVRKSYLEVFGHTDVKDLMKANEELFRTHPQLVMKSASEMEYEIFLRKYKPKLFSKGPVPADVIAESKRIHRDVTLLKPSESEKLDMIAEIRGTKAKDYAHQIEKDAALALYESYPKNWQSSGRKYVDYEFTATYKKGANPGEKVIAGHDRRIYETDVELDCCIVEVTVTGSEKLRDSKFDQIKRYLNEDGRWDFINPDNKKVIIFTPNVPARPDWLKPNVIFTNNILDLKRAVVIEIKLRKAAGQ